MRAGMYRYRQADAKRARTDRGKIVAMRGFGDLDDALGDTVERKRQRARSQRGVGRLALHDGPIRQALQRLDIACGHGYWLLR